MIDNHKFGAVCPACLHTDTVRLFDLGDEEDSDGTFGNYYVECSCCGRRTEDMDTEADAIEAWEDRMCHNVYYADADTVLVKLSDPRIRNEFTVNEDLRKRMGAWGE